MPNFRFRHHNQCPRCPVIGAEDIAGEEYFDFRSLRFNLQIARKLCHPAMLHRVDPIGLKRLLKRVHVDPAHVDHLPRNLGPGIMATFPSGLGLPLIDGNHRAARSLRDGTEFVAYLLPEAETHELLRRSMGATTADHYWNRMRDSKPHPDDVPEGE
jgi:hypothetical protein